ncbi:MAG: Translation initiation factor IF-2 [Nitrosopumilales archaeon]|nr:MAG: Translation initiation factor IF-2 [Nitrosopumilales archaeon]
MSSFLKNMTKADYEKLLKRIEGNLSDEKKQTTTRFELPTVDVMWEGQKTFLRNFAEFPKILRRNPDKVLQYLSKEFAVPAERIGDKAMFIGRRDPDDFTRLFQIYVKDYLECPTCKSPDTKIVKENRITFLICEACGAKSTMKGKYA